VHGFPLGGVRSAGKNGDAVATALKVTRQDLAYLSTATRNDNAKWSHGCKIARDHQVEFSLMGFKDASAKGRVLFDPGVL